MALYNCSGNNSTCGNVGGVSNNSSCPYGNVGGISNSNCSLSCTDWLLIFIALILLLVVFLG